MLCRTDSFSKASRTCVVSGLKPAAKRAVAESVRSGEAQLLVGTHALLEDPVEFARLGLAIVDEQHRFGVLQRKRLIEKADRAGCAGDDRHADPAYSFRSPSTETWTSQ